VKQYADLGETSCRRSRTIAVKCVRGVFQLRSMGFVKLYLQFRDVICPR